MVDTRHLQIGQTAQRHAVVENKSELAPVLIPRPNILEKIAPKMDQITRRENATRRNVQWMEALLHSPTSRLVARPVGVVLSHVYALAPILNPSLAARIALVITKRRESAILSHVQSMEAMTNGETILNVLLHAVVEIRCACVLAPTQCRRMEENPAWVYTHRPENATLKPAQSTVVIPHGVNFQLAVRLVEEVCNREQEHASIQLQPMAGKTVASLEQPTSHKNVAQSNVQLMEGIQSGLPGLPAVLLAVGE